MNCQGVNSSTIAVCVHVGILRHRWSLLTGLLLCPPETPPEPGACLPAGVMISAQHVE